MKMSISLAMLPRTFLSVLLASSLLAACGGSDNDAPPADTTPPVTDPGTPPTTEEPETPVVTGAWSKGDLHVHTYQSDDAQVSLEHVLDQAFDRYKLDWAAISNHLRLSGRDHTGANLPMPIPFSQGMAEYEVPFIRQMQEAGRYAGKTIFTSFEWDMPTHDHVNVGIGVNDPMSPAALQAVAEFEYLFTNRDPNLFDPALVSRLSGETRAYTTHEDSLAALQWLRDKHSGDSYMLLNHPSRYMNRYTAGQIREMHDLAPEVFFTIEGMVGNQMEPDRGGYAEAYVPANLPSRTYGGTDYLVAKLGGTWDALLGEGRRIWTVADSDYHFRTAQGQFSSGYAPGEYSKTYVWKDGDDMAAVMAGLRSGRVYGVFGDLIDHLDFSAQGTAGTVHMGGELVAAKDEEVEVTIRFRSPETNNYEYPFDSGNPTYTKPTVNHVDLIVGDVTGKAQAGTPEYDADTNPSTKVLARFTKDDWTVDEAGYNVITYRVTATHSQYLRLRGTNQGIDVANETADGEPLPDEKIDFADNAHRFNAINARNYNDLWFYSNPVFVTVAD